MEDKKQAERKAFIRKIAFQSIMIVLIGALLLFIFLMWFFSGFVDCEDEYAHGAGAVTAQYREVSAETI